MIDVNEIYSAHYLIKVGGDEINMATDVGYIDFVCEQILGVGDIRYRKMFGEYMVYVNEKPLLLVCDNTVYVKKLDCLYDLLKDASVGIPYKGSKEHYILDIDNRELIHEVIVILEDVTPVPKKRKKAKK